MATCKHYRITQHIRYGLSPLPFGTLFPSVATSYMLEPLGEMHLRETVNVNNYGR
jgi:hypothetical protein